MTNDDSAPDQPDPSPEPPPPAAPLDPPKARWGDRVFRLRALVAVALASVIVGAGSGVVGTLAFDNDQDRSGRHEQVDRPGDRAGFPGQGGPGNRQDAPPQGTFPLPPGTAPQQEEDDQPDDGETSSS